MHTCISSHGLKRSWRSCPRRVNAGNKNTPSTHHPWRRNVTTLMVGLKKRSHTQKSHPQVVNPRDIAGERKKKKKKKKQSAISSERNCLNSLAVMVSVLKVGGCSLNHNRAILPTWKTGRLHWRLPCQMPGIMGSVLGLVDPVSVYVDWVRANYVCNSSGWQHVELLKKSHSWDAFCVAGT